MKSGGKLVFAAATLALFAAGRSGAQTGGRITHLIAPSQTDSAIAHFNEPHYVALDRASESADLVVFLPGTNGKPSNASRLLNVVADQGYRVIGLMYNDAPAVVELCPRNPLPACSGNFRQKRIFGTEVASVVDNPPAEAIVNRLVKLIMFLKEHYPNEHWAQYLDGDDLKWSRVVVSGLSQGAGMAAYLAKRKKVARVVLFSSPWDFYGSRTLAPWISEASATPPERWFAEYHRRENTADLIARAYRALKIPDSHIRIFDLDLPPGREGGGGENKFHGITIRDERYVTQWQFLFGRANADTSN